MLRALRVIGLLALASLMPRVALADEPLIAVLAWSAPEGCLQQAALERRVERMLSRTAFRADEGDVRISGQARRDGDAWVADIEMVVPDGGRAHRELRVDHSECTALADGLTFVLALLVDLPRDEITLLATETQVAPAHVEPAAAASPEPVAVVAEEPAARSGGLWTGLGAGLQLAHQVVPGSAPGLRVGMRLEGAGWPIIELGLGAWLPSTAAVDGAGATFVAWTAGVHTCPRVSFDWFAIGGCVGIEAGGLHTSGFGLDRTSDPIAPLVMAGARLLLSVRIDALEITLGPGILIPLIPERFTYLSDGEAVLLFEPWPVTPWIVLEAFVWTAS